MVDVDPGKETDDAIMSSKQLNNMHFIQANTTPHVEGYSSNPSVQAGQVNTHVYHHFHHTAWSAEDAKQGVTQFKLWRTSLSSLPKISGNTNCGCSGGYGCGCGENREHENEICKEREESYTRVIQRNPGGYPQPVRHRVKLAILAKL
ncbi:hypothetical protein BG000_011184 [Podila horticola]|nr:hypothetical protein BG000_011184 [Podila horticola]